MKRTLTLIFVFATVLCHAQKSVKLKMNYAPNHSYSIQVKDVMNMVMDADVDSATREQLKAGGMNFPMEVSAIKDLTTVLKTGESNDKKEIPITMEYTQFTTSQKMGGMEMPAGENMMKGLKATGFSSEEGKLRIENVEGTTMSEDLKKIMTSTFDQFGTYIVFPEKALKVGDEFTQEVPLEMVMGAGVKMNMLIKTTYKLQSFTKENAFFDTVIAMRMDMALDMSAEKAAMSASGSGTGKMVFDIGKNYVSTNSSDMDMTMKIMTGQMDMGIKAKTKSEMKVTHL